MNTRTQEKLFRVRDDCGDRDPDLPGCRYFAVRSDESHMSGWVSETEYQWLCERLGVSPPEKPVPPPMLFTHDCEDCLPLGQYDGHDLYFCTQGGNALTVIARYGNGGHEYQSGLEGAALSEPLAEAKRRAIELNYIYKDAE